MSIMKHSLRQLEISKRRAFTLVELLVAVGILVILTTLTVTAFTVNDADRVSNSIGTFKNALEGARSRAISAGEIRGLRLLTDPSDGRVVKSVVYVGSAGELIGNLTITGYSASNNRFGIQETDSNWGPLGDGERELIKRGTKIEIPARSGRWYTVFESPMNSSDTTMIVSGRFMPSVWNGSSFQEVPNGATFSYRILLEPAVLDGAEPILLDSQTGIDMDGSAVPGSWRPGASGDAYGVDSSGSPTVTTKMDILFAPDGTITGDLRTESPLRFRFAYISDIVLAASLGSRPLIGSSATAVVPSNPEKAHKALSISLQTGGILITEIDPTTSDSNNGFNSNRASQPFNFALQGRESN